jgi:hypothetical protein
MRIVVFSLLCLVSLSGCANKEGITCTLLDWHLTCGSTLSGQDSPSSIEGVEDEKPVRTFQKPFSRLEKASS